MREILIGITADDLEDFKHRLVTVSASRPWQIYSLSLEEADSLLKLSDAELNGKLAQLKARTAAGEVTVVATGNVLKIKGLSDKEEPKQVLIMQLAPGDENTRDIHLLTVSRNQHNPIYRGLLKLKAEKGSIRIILRTNLENYVSGVLQSEMPGAYNLEAIKAQAVAARTYGLNPRINHSDAGFNVCDSYLCCQFFAGKSQSGGKHESAIHNTEGQILLFEEKPILALFSACAGGHTDNYDNCFSDPTTGQFPAPPIPYLVGVPEGKLPKSFGNWASDGDQGLRELWSEAHAPTCDSWAPQFRWSQTISADSLEAHMHHVVTTMLADKTTKPFITPPPSMDFGLIKYFSVPKRGPSGVAIELIIDTSEGVWTVRKELVIRSIFKNNEAKLARLRSARIFFDHSRDKNGLLSKLEISGLGSGHGVGMQQVGAEGLARSGKTYRDILAHYFKGAVIGSA